jgi:hypothetical protein
MRMLDLLPVEQGAASAGLTPRVSRRRAQRANAGCALTNLGTWEKLPKIDLARCRSESEPTIAYQESRMPLRRLLSLSRAVGGADPTRAGFAPHPRE